MAQYPIPPWLAREGADPAGAFISAFSAGANVSAQKARLAQEAEETAMRLAVYERQQEKDNLIKQQEMELNRARNDALLGLRQQQLELDQSRLAQDAIKAAADFAMRGQQASDLSQYRADTLAQTGRRDQATAIYRADQLAQGDERYQLQADKYADSLTAQNRIRERIAAGEDARQVYLEEGPAARVPGMGSIVGRGDEAGVDWTAKPPWPVPELGPNAMAAYTGRGSVRYFNTGLDQSGSELAEPVYDNEGNFTGYDRIRGAAPGGRDKFIKRDRPWDTDIIKRAREDLYDLESDPDPDDETIAEMNRLRKLIQEFESKGAGQRKTNKVEIIGIKKTRD